MTDSNDGAQGRPVRAGKTGRSIPYLTEENRFSAIEFSGRGALPAVQAGVNPGDAGGIAA